jgi:hypothetical protein
VPDVFLPRFARCLVPELFDAHLRRLLSMCTFRHGLCLITAERNGENEESLICWNIEQRKNCYGEIFPFTDAISLHYRRWMPAIQAKVARS